MALGPVMMDIAGLELLPEDVEILRHPLVGGLILFSRNFQDRSQLSALVRAVHALRTPRLLVAVDHEGGRVQRFRESFTELPPARVYGTLYNTDAATGEKVAELGGWLAAVELRSVGIDMTFAPVLDLDHGRSSVIGDRAFHRSADVVARLGRAWMLGMRRAGMAATGKHFPGHGAVAEDSHVMLPRDDRPLGDIRLADMLPFERLIRSGLASIMIAHVVYSDLDELPASLSRAWVQGELRARLDFRGTVFCDDLGMAGVSGYGDYVERARLALDAGCDMLPICNDRPGVEAVLDTLDGYENPASQLRLVRLHGRETSTAAANFPTAEWQQAVETIKGYYPGPELELDI